MTITQLVFHAFVLLTGGAALALALSRNVVHAAFLLFLALLGMAGLYVFAGAEFLAVSQVIVYVGGTLVVVIFGVMLTAKMRDMKPQTEIVNLIPGAVLAVALFSALLFVIQDSGIGAANPPAGNSGGDNVKTIGVATLTDYLLPFELVSVLLLTVLVGAAYLSRRFQPGKEEETE
ncbi:MAG: NAD(P)H-quinone oxidoreductase subunit 6 [Bacteroidota bacterium]|jgi:NADH-quinone oxidoreductase subunit J